MSLNFDYMHYVSGVLGARLRERWYQGSIHVSS